MMSAALLWITLPAAAAAAVAVWGENRYWVSVAACGLAALLALLAWFLPVDEPISAAGLRFQIEPTFVVLGRVFLLDAPLLRIVSALYGAVFLWISGALVIRPGRFFIPSGLAAGAFLVAAWSVQPWQFAGIFIMLAVLILVPVLAPPGSPPKPGVVKFLAFLTIGVPFFLLAGTLMEGIESIPAGLAATVRPSILLGFSFAFLLALFPFHAWIPVLFEQEDVYTAAFIQVLLTLSVGVIGLQIIDRYLWLRSSDAFFTFVRTIGFMSVLMGGIWAAAQRHAGRIFAFSTLFDTGVLLIAIGAGPGTAPVLFFSLAVARCIGFFAFAVGLKLAQQRRQEVTLRGLRGLSAESPTAALGLLVGPFSLAGLPLLAGFPSKLLLLRELSAGAPSAAAVLMFGMAASGTAGLRMLVAVVQPRDSETHGEDEAAEEVAGQTPETLGLLGVFAAALVAAAGILPGWVFRAAETLQGAFEHLMR